MKMLVTARHCEIPEDLRERAVALIEREARKVSRPKRAEVVFDDDHQCKIVEIQLHLARGHARVCTAEADDFRTALDRAVGKLRNQLDEAEDRPSRRAAAGGS